MRKIQFNEGWHVRKGIAGPFDILAGQNMEGSPVTLPHDAMIEEVRSAYTSSGLQYGFYPAGSYTYSKTFFVPESWAEKENILEFEGISQNAMVYLNGEFLTGHKGGYTGFFVNLGAFLRYGQENTLKVLTVSKEQASRWYPGSGIYRDVWLWQGGRSYFVPEKQKVTTVSVEDDYAVICVEGRICNTQKQARKLRIELSVLQADGSQVAREECVFGILDAQSGEWHTRVTIESPHLWSVEEPNLYRCICRLYDGDVLMDENEETFGIRTLKLDARRGFRINGMEVKLRGACIHHDNGMLGAISVRDAEEFRLKKLKEAGFNAIRSAHNPAGKALLETCDKLGILVMDELTDMWNEPKNGNDQALDFQENWMRELEGMVDKDYNHPSVILYSIGNEIPEIGRVSGAAYSHKLAACLHRLDASRYSTFGMNGFLAVTDDLHLFASVTQQPESESETAGGSEELNRRMGETQKQMMDQFAVSEILTNRLEAAASSVDVVGYNYLTARHVLEHQLHPDRVIVGSETYPPEIARLWKIVQENPHVIGDFTWTGFDYLGEAGIGIYHYDEKIQSQGQYPDRLAYCGDIDVNGTRRPVSYLREIAYGLREAPFIAVERLEKAGRYYDSNNWKYADCIDSWTFYGYEGEKTKVRILSGGEEVELFLNGSSLGRKPVGSEEALTSFYELAYEPGELRAVSYREGKVSGQTLLRTAGTGARLQCQSSRESMPADGQSLAFITVDLSDERGIWNRQEEKEVTVHVEGAAVLQAFGSAAPSGEGSYQELTWKTWDGRVMAVIRSTREVGEIRVSFSAPGCPEETVLLQSITP